MTDPIERWHEFVKTRDPAVLDALLADDAVMISPAVHTPQRGKAITARYLRAAAKVLGGEAMAYIGEWSGDRSTMLEFTSEVDGMLVNGVDMIRWDEAGRITEFKVMVRPVKALHALMTAMAAELAIAEPVA